jgi:serine/alanine adding enzyme
VDPPGIVVPGIYRPIEKRDYMTQYKIVHQVNQEKWTEFVKQHPNGNIFQTPQMYQIYKGTKNYTPLFLGVVDERDHILGILLAHIIREYSGLAGKFTSRSIILGGPLVKGKDQDNNQHIVRELLTQYNKEIRNKAIYSEIRNLFSTQDYKTAIQSTGFTFQEHLDIHFDLKQSSEELLKKVHKERRHNIRRAIKKGTLFREISQEKLKEAYSLIQKTYNRAKLPNADFSLFESAFEILSPLKQIKMFAAINEKKIIAVRLVLCYKKTIYDWYAGSLFEERNKYPNDFLPWETLLWAKNNGFEIFDFGGAGKPNKPYGVRDYKMKFGGQLILLGRFHKVHQPILMKMGKLGFYFYKKIRK